MPGPDPRKTKAKPVRKNFETIMSEIDPRDKKEMIKKGKLQKIKPQDPRMPFVKPTSIKKMKKGGRA